MPLAAREHTKAAAAAAALQNHSTILEEIEQYWLVNQLVIVGIAHFTTEPTRSYRADMKPARSSELLKDAADRVMLDPHVSIPASEAWLFRNDKAIDSVRRGLEEVAAGKAISHGSFAKFAEDHG